MIIDCIFVRLMTPFFDTSNLFIKQSTEFFVKQHNEAIGNDVIIIQHTLK